MTPPTPVGPTSTRVAGRAKIDPRFDARYTKVDPADRSSLLVDIVVSMIHVADWSYNAPSTYISVPVWSSIFVRRGDSDYGP